MLKAFSKENMAKFRKDLKFAFYCTTHPMDGFWDLTHEHRGSYAVANIMLFLVIATRIAMVRFEGFLFNDTYWPEENIFKYLGAILLPLGLWCVANWALTTLFDGKGRLGQIYIASCYCLIPYWAVHIPLIIFSNFVTLNEADLISVISTVSLVYCGFLIFCAMTQIHEYSFGKAFLFIIGTILGICVIIFVLLIFFSMASQGIGYFVSLYRELKFRL